MARPENEFPTIRDVHARLAELIEQGLGDLPASLLVVPDSTIQAIARVLSGAQDKPAMMIDLPGIDGRMAVGIIAVERLSRGDNTPTSIN